MAKKKILKFDGPGMKTDRKDIENFLNIYNNEQTSVFEGIIDYREEDKKGFINWLRIAPTRIYNSAHGIPKIPKKPRLYIAFNTRIYEKIIGDECIHAPTGLDMPCGDRLKVIVNGSHIVNNRYFENIPAILNKTTEDLFIFEYRPPSKD